MEFNSFLAIGCGAAAGAWLRWGFGLLLNPIFPTLPLGTLTANLVGGLLMGVAMALIAHFEALSPTLRLLVTTGFLGGLTTFSTFSAETVSLLTRQQYAWTAAIVGLHVVGSVLMTLLGIAITEAALRS
jgi:fluoride exporter